MPFTSDYRLFGLTVRSGLPLPELSEVDRVARPDVDIRVGSRASLERQRGRSITIDGVVHFDVLEGREITVVPEDGASARNVRLYLLGSAIGLLLHQRRLLPLHANAVEIDGKAYAFLGPSGAGKSTLAMAFHDRGFRVLADDVCVVRMLDDGRFIVSPGLPRARLWRDSLEALGRDSNDHAKSYSGDEDWDKYDVGLGSGAAPVEGIELAGVHLLGVGEDFRLSRLGGASAVEALMANTYRGAFVGETNGARYHWQDCTSVAKAVPILQFSRPLNFHRLDEGVAFLLSAVRIDGPSAAVRA